MGTKFDARIEELEQSISNQSQELFKLRQQQAIETCPFKVGDKVKNKKGLTGEVIRIKPGWGGRPGEPIIILFKKDGTQGKRTTEAWTWENWQLSDKED